MIRTLTPEMKMSDINSTLKLANSGDTILVPAHEVDMVKRSLKRLYPGKNLTVKAIEAAAALPQEMKL